MKIYPDEPQVTDADFVFNFVATYHISKAYTKNTMVYFNFTDYKIQTNKPLREGYANCTNLTWSINDTCKVTPDSIEFKWVVNYTKREDKI